MNIVEKKFQTIMVTTGLHSDEYHNQLINDGYEFKGRQFSILHGQNVFVYELKREENEKRSN